MTCIAALVEDGTVYMAGDSACMGGLDLTLLADGKLARVGEFVIGITGSVRLIQLVRHRFAPPAIPAGADLAAYMATGFIDALRECFKDAGFARRDSDREHAGASQLLVGVRGRLFTIYGDYGLAESALGYSAVGCGDQVALGALFGGWTRVMGPETRLEVALRAAEQFSTGVRGPFTFVTLPAPLQNNRDQ